MIIQERERERERERKNNLSIKLKLQNKCINNLNFIYINKSIIFFSL